MSHILKKNVDTLSSSNLVCGHFWTFLMPYPLSCFPHFYHPCPFYTIFSSFTHSHKNSPNLTQPQPASLSLTQQSTLQISHNLTYLKYIMLEACRHENRPKNAFEPVLMIQNVPIFPRLTICSFWSE